MANKKNDRYRIIELAMKQPKEDQLFIINGIVKGLSEDNANAKSQVKIEKLEAELSLYKQNSPKLVKEHIENTLNPKKEEKQ